MTGMNTVGLIGLTEENVGIDRRFYTGLTTTNHTFAVSYNAGRVDVFLNGIKLVGNHTGNANYDYTMDSTTGTGSSITLATGVALVLADVVECIGYVSNSSNTVTSYNPTPASGDGGWNVFINITYTASDLVNVFLNGVLLDDSDYTLDASNNKVTIGGATLTANDVVVIQVIGALDHSNFVPAGGGTFTGDVTLTSTSGAGVTVIDSDDKANGYTLRANGTRFQITENGVADSFVIEAGGSVGIGDFLSSTPATQASADKFLEIKKTSGIAGLGLNGGGDSRFELISDTGDDFKILRNGSEKFKIDGSTSDATITSGNLVIGSAGKGIDFSAQTASSATGATPDTTGDSEILNHCERGSWTPAFNLGSWSVPAANKYCRVGNIVTCFLQATCNTPGTSGNAVLISQLPFPILDSDRAIPVGFMAARTSVTVTSAYAMSTSQIALYSVSSGASYSLFNDNSITATGGIYVSFTYICS